MGASSASELGVSRSPGQASLASVPAVASMLLVRRPHRGTSGPARVTPRWQAARCTERETCRDCIGSSVDAFPHPHAARPLVVLRDGVVREQAVSTHRSPASVAFVAVSQQLDPSEPGSSILQVVRARWLSAVLGVLTWCCAPWRSFRSRCRRIVGSLVRRSRWHLFRGTDERPAR